MSFGVRSNAPTAEADTDATLAIWCGFLPGVIDGDPDDAVGAGDIAAACDGLSQADIALIGDAVGDEDGSLEDGELDDLDLDANQITDGGGLNALGMPLDEIYIIAFVDDDGRVTFDAETGVTVAINSDGTGGEADPVDDGNVETCDGPDDLDCGTTTQDNGDGVVVATIADDTAGDGTDIDVEVDQEGVGNTETVSVVGGAFAVELTLVETTIQSDASASCADGTDPEVTDGSALSDPESTVAIAVAVDNDDRALTRILTDISSDDDNIAEIGDDTAGFSVDGGSSGIAAFAVVCGGDTTGTVDIVADIGTDDDSAELTVVGEPATVTLTASPAAIACDGTATSSVSATVTDSDGNNVANGTNVNFSVVALGTANPINATTTDGAATSTITPLSGATAGVTVIVSAGSAQASIRVDCLPELATPVGPQPTPTTPGGVTPPDTGNGGYLGQDSSAGFPLWTLVALALGSVALVAGGLVTRRAGQ
jgi:hypothetical protein